MRILIVSNLYPPNVVGGYERLCYEVTDGLAALGHEMVVLTTRYGGKTAEYPGQRVLRELDLLTGADIYTPFPGTAEDRAAVNRSNLATLHRVLEEVRPDVVFSWNLFFLDASILQALEQSRTRTVVMLTDNWLLVMRNPIFVRDFFQDVVHGDTPFVPPPEPTIAQRLWRRARRMIGRPAAGVDAIFGAQFMRDFYAKGGVGFSRYRIVHNGVKQSAHRDAASPDRSGLVQPGTLRLLFAGRLVDLKGAHTAVAAMSLLSPAALGVDRVLLTIVGDGQDAGYTQQLDTAIGQSGQAANIVRQAPVPEDQLAALFNAHDIYLFPSLYEPFSLTLIHALALGIPTVASRIGGNPEIVREGESGLLFHKGDPADLARAVTRLSADPALRARLAEGGRQAAAGFTFERMVKSMAHFLEHP